jgi:hypothetical protein
VFRILIALAVVGVLVACTDQRGEASAQPTGSLASTAGAAGGAATPDCEEAFDGIVEMDELGRPRIDTPT